MKIIFDRDDAVLAAYAMAKSRGLSCDFSLPYPPDSTEDLIMRESLRVVAAFRDKYGS
jgi:hypothetical protein